MEKHFEIVEAASPERCQANDKNAQCMFKAVKGQEYCPRHVGRYSTQEKKKIRNFKIERWKTRINEFADNEQVKCLREEIGITRLMLEEILNQCPDTNTLLCHSARILEFISKIQALVISCHKLELSTNQLIGKNIIIAIGQSIVNVIGTHIQDETVLTQMSQEILNVLENIISTDSSEGIEQEVN